MNSNHDAAKYSPAILSFRFVYWNIMVGKAVRPARFCPSWNQWTCHTARKGTRRDLRWAGPAEDVHASAWPGGILGNRGVRRERTRSRLVARERDGLRVDASPEGSAGEGLLPAAMHAVAGLWVGAATWSGFYLRNFVSVKPVSAQLSPTAADLVSIHLLSVSLPD